MKLSTWTIYASAESNELNDFKANQIRILFSAVFIFTVYYSVCFVFVCLFVLRIGKAAIYSHLSAAV